MWERTEVICAFIQAYLAAIFTIVSLFKQQGNSVYQPNRVTTFPVVAFLGSSVFSRPPFNSKWKAIRQLIATLQCPSSGLLCIPDLLAPLPSGDLFLIHT